MQEGYKKIEHIIKRSSRVRVYSILGSFLLHILLLIVFTRNFSSVFHTDHPLIVEKENQDKIIEFELVEVDPVTNDELPGAETNLISDKNTLARDEFPDDQGLLPRSPGEYDNKDYQARVDVPEQAEIEPVQEKKIKDILRDSELAGLLGSDKDLTVEEYFQEPDPDRRLSYENLLSSVPDFGGVTFNTYDWEFAPYLLTMKRKIQDKINPPYAFTHMGIIGGENVVRFIVNKNGSIRSLEILTADGHSSLTTTSRNAIELSDPFLPLPEDFPENFLEVTARFAYIIRKK